MSARPAARAERWALVLVALVAASAGACLVAFPPGADNAMLHLPYFELRARAAAAHVFPLWDPTVFGGIPLVGDPRGLLFYPPSWVSALGSPIRALAVYDALHVLIGTLGAFVAARSLGSRVGSALVAALVYLLAGETYFQRIIEGQTDYLPGVAWFPWVLATLDRALRRADRRSIAAAAAAVFVFLLGTHPDYVLMGLVLAAFYLAVEWLAAMRRDGAPGERGAGARGLVACGTALGLGAAAASAQLLPVAWYARESTRSLAVVPEYYRFHDVPSAFSLLARTLDGFSFGTTPVVLAAIGLLACHRGATSRRGGLGLVAIFATALVLVAGPQTSIGRAFYALPLLSQINWQERHVFFAALAVSLLAARGCDAILGRAREPAAFERVAQRSLLSLVVVGWVILQGNLPFYAVDARPRIAFFPGTADPRDPAALEGFAGASLESVANFQVPPRRLACAALVLLAWGGSFAAWRLLGERRGLRRGALGLVLLATSVDLALSHYDFRRVYWDRLTEREPGPPGLDVAGRVVPLATHGEDSAAPVSGPTARARGLRTLVGNSRWMAAGFADLMEVATGRPLGEARPDPRSFRIESLDSPLWDALDIDVVVARCLTTARARVGNGRIRWDARGSCRWPAWFPMPRRRAQRSARPRSIPGARS
ncbi:MAG: 6-pyruvoyl-tetrahydropterin synthase-related protein [bacterium]